MKSHGYQIEASYIVKGSHIKFILTWATSYCFIDKDE